MIDEANNPVEEPSELLAGAAPTDDDLVSSTAGNARDESSEEADAPADSPSPETPERVQPKQVEAAADESADDERADDERADDERADDERAADERAADEGAVDEGVVDERAAGEGVVDEIAVAGEMEIEGDSEEADLSEAIEADAGESPEDVQAASEPAESAPPVEESAEEEEEAKKDWYILKVQSNREGSIRDGLIRRVKIAGLEEYFGDVIVPTEKVTEFKGKKKRVVERKLYPGYIVVHMAITDDTWFLVRETPGIGDFTGAGGKPTPMLPHEVDRIVPKEADETSEEPGLDIAFSVGDRVKVTEGNFENFEGEVESIDAVNGRVTVMIMIFGRSTPVELEYWQIESI